MSASPQNNAASAILHFTRDEYAERLSDAGFVAARFPHEHGIWMLAAAEKPAEQSKMAGPTSIMNA